MATIGGNLAHGDYQSDPPTVLVALDATVEITSGRGAREMPLSDFQRGSYETALDAGRIDTAISFRRFRKDLGEPTSNSPPVPRKSAPARASQRSRDWKMEYVGTFVCLSAPYRRGRYASLPAKNSLEAKALVQN